MPTAAPRTGSMGTVPWLRADRHRASLLPTRVGRLAQQHIAACSADRLCDAQSGETDANHDESYAFKFFALRLPGVRTRARTLAEFAHADGTGIEGFRRLGLPCLGCVGTLFAQTVLAGLSASRGGCAALP